MYLLLPQDSSKEIMFNQDVISVITGMMMLTLTYMFVWMVKEIISMELILMLFTVEIIVQN